MSEFTLNAHKMCVHAPSECVNRENDASECVARTWIGDVESRVCVCV